MDPNATPKPSVFDWVKLAILLAQGFGALISYLRTRDLLNAGGAEAIAKILRAQADDLHKIKDTMAAAGKQFDNAGGVPADLEYRD